MKNISKYLVLLVAVLFSFTACEQDIKRDPSPIFETANSVFFPVSSLSKEFEPTDTYEQIVAIQRDTTNIDSALVVKLHVVTNTKEVFVVPDSVAFAKGEAKTSFTVKFPNAEIDSLYTLVIELDVDKSNPYLDAKPTFTFNATVAKWDIVTDKKAVIFDGLVNAFYSTGNPGWYVSYARKDNADKSFDIRLFNPYTVLPEYKIVEGKPDYDSPIADKFGLYTGFPYNYPTDVDSKGTYNMTIHVNEKGEASFDAFDMGMAWSYGEFTAQYMKDPDLPGVWNKDDKSITFPPKSAACFMANFGGRYTSENIVIYIDDSLYQDIHSVITVESLKGGCNDASLEWDTIPGELSTLVSKIQPVPGMIDVRFENSIDPNPESKQGKGSDFFNLYRLTDVYAPGYCLAFYWDTIKNEVKMPLFLQPTGLNFAGKDLYVGKGATDCYIEEATLGGKPAKLFHLFMQLQTKDGGNLGEYEEVYYYCNEKIVWGEKAEDFVGTYSMTGTSPFDGTDVQVDVKIAMVDSQLVLDGLDYCSGVLLDFDDTDKTISLYPQEQDSIGGKYDITVYTMDAAGKTSATAPIVFAMQFGGILKLTDESPAIGFLTRSEAAGGWLDGAYDLTLTPSAPAAAAPAKAPSFRVNNTFAEIKQKAVTPKNADFKFQGKVWKRNIRLKD